MARSSNNRTKAKTKTKLKAKARTAKRVTKRRTRKAGAVIGTGGYGCVFSPPLPCEGESRPGNDVVSKLLYKVEAMKEMKEIEKAKKVLSRIPNANKYFSVMDVKKCQLGELTEDDIKGKNCDAIDVYHVKNQMRDVGYDNTVALLQQKNFGMPFDQYVLKEVKNGEQMSSLLANMKELLMKGIVPMNNLGVYHEDLKADNILVQNGQPTIIDWGLAVINEDGGPITKAEFANNDVFWNEREGKPAMTANPLFNNPLVGAAFFSPAEPDEQVGIVKRQLQLEGRSDEAKIQSLLEDLQSEPHFALLESQILPIALDYLQQLGYKQQGTLHETPDSLLEEYLQRNLNAYSPIESHYDEFVKNFQSNVDLWGWAMSIGMLVTEDDIPSFFTTNKEVRNYYGGLSKMIYYLFTEGAVKIDPNRLVEYLNEIYPAEDASSAISSTPVQGGKKRATRRRYKNKSKGKSKKQHRK
jgi:serine/threonine protein kinase